MAVERRTVFGGMERGAGIVAKILAKKRDDLKNSSSDQDNASGTESGTGASMSDMAAQIKMLEEMEKEAQEKAAKYHDQDQQLKEQQEQQENQKQNQQEMVIELLLEEEKRRKMQEFCDAKGLNLSVTKEGEFRIADKDGNEMKAVKQSFEKAFAQSKDNQHER